MQVLSIAEQRQDARDLVGRQSGCLLDPVAQVAAVGTALRRSAERQQPTAKGARPLWAASESAVSPKSLIASTVAPRATRSSPMPVFPSIALSMSKLQENRFERFGVD